MGKSGRSELGFAEIVVFVLGEGAPLPKIVVKRCTSRRSLHFSPVFFPVKNSNSSHSKATTELLNYCTHHGNKNNTTFYLKIRNKRISVLYSKPQ